MLFLQDKIKFLLKGPDPWARLAKLKIRRPRFGEACPRLRQLYRFSLWDATRGKRERASPTRQMCGCRGKGLGGSNPCLERFSLGKKQKTCDGIESVRRAQTSTARRPHAGSS